MVKRRLDRANEYVPVRLGEHNAQTTWVLARAGASVAEFLPHVRRHWATSDDEPEPRSG